MAFILILKNAAGTCKYDTVWDIINDLFQDDVVDQVFTQCFYGDNTFYPPYKEGVILRDWEVTFKKVTPLIAEFIVKSTSTIQYAPDKFWKVDIKEFEHFCNSIKPLDREFAKLEHEREKQIQVEHALTCPFPISKLYRQYAEWMPHQLYSEDKNMHYIRELERYA